PRGFRDDSCTRQAKEAGHGTGPGCPLPILVEQGKQTKGTAPRSHGPVHPAAIAAGSRVVNVQIRDLWIVKHTADLLLDSFPFKDFRGQHKACRVIAPY